MLFLKLLRLPHIINSLHRLVVVQYWWWCFFFLTLWSENIKGLCEMKWRERDVRKKRWITSGWSTWSWLIKCLPTLLGVPCLISEENISRYLPYTQSHSTITSICSYIHLANVVKRPIHQNHILNKSLKQNKAIGFCIRASQS